MNQNCVVRSRLLGMTLLLGVALVFPTFSRAASVASVVPGDLGDAPDSTNHFGVAMLAYAGVPARYPTVFDVATGAPEGPVHANPTLNGWLGAGVSSETDADVLPDADGLRNIDPPTNTSNQDRFDDGVLTTSPLITLPACGATQFRYVVTGAAAVLVPTNYVNVWIDYNRDGDWEDRFTCTDPSGAVLTVLEWSVRNQVVTVVPGSVVWSTPVFPAFHASASPDHWMRINIAEQKAVNNPVTGLADGRGQPNTYRYGETEDYVLRYSGGTSYKPM